MTIITGDYTYGSDNISLLDFTHKYKVKIGKFCLIYIYIYMKKLLIRNTLNYHYEIIESVIVKYREIFNLIVKK